MKHRSLVSGCKPTARMQRWERLLISFYFNNTTQLYWHCCHFISKSMKKQSQVIHKILNPQRLGSNLWGIYVEYGEGGYDIFTGTGTIRTKCPGGASNVPGSAEANGGLQKTHCCEKRLLVEPHLIHLCCKSEKCTFLFAFHFTTIQIQN